MFAQSYFQNLHWAPRKQGKTISRQKARVQENNCIPYRLFLPKMMVSGLLKVSLVRRRLRNVWENNVIHAR